MSVNNSTRKWNIRAQEYLRLLALEGKDQAREYRARFRNPEKLDAMAKQLRPAHVAPPR